MNGAEEARRWSPATSLPSCFACRTLSPMTTTAWITMIAVMTFVWGGFLIVVRTAVRRESGKTDT